MEGIKTCPLRNNPVEEEVNKPVSEANNPEASESGSEGSSNHDGLHES